ncbi:MAG: hypothetical protein ACYC4U_17220 [Pirellulaceae bacterium]
MRDSSHISAAQASEQIGPRAFGRILTMVRRHYVGQEALSFRIAPSITCRSEIELLGVAAPRFALRAILTSSAGRGFMNCRRLAVLAEQLASEADVRWNAINERLESLKRDDLDTALRLLRERIEISGGIAESVLPVPDSLSQFHVIWKDFTQIFGESQPIKGTPFVNAIALGGGSCSQGTCFLATLLRVDDVTFVHSPSEITALVRQDSELRSLELNGLSVDEILSYFRHEFVGLNSYHEVGARKASTSLGLSENIKQVTDSFDLLTALRSYLLSDIPVIALLDTDAYCDRVLSSSRNCISAKPPPGDKGRHCVLLVGTRCSDSSDQAESTVFLAHDPLIGPWITLSVGDLEDCRVGGTANESTPFVRLLPVLPGSVKTHLLPALPEGATKNHLGLLRIATLIQRDRRMGSSIYGSLVNELPICQGHRLVREFRLVSLEQIRDGQFPRRIQEFLSDDCGFLIAVANGKLRNLNWVWIQRARHAGVSYSHSLWFWDASVPVGHEASELGDHLQLVAVDDSQVRESCWRVVFESTSLDEVSMVSHDVMGALDGHGDACTHSTDPALTTTQEIRTPELKPSLITSFLPRKLASVKRCWPAAGDGVGCELYAFMLSDSDFIIRNLRMSDLRCQRELPANAGLHFRLDWLRQDPVRVSSLANAISKLFSPEIRPIVAIASYIPEISNPPASVSAQRARGALACLCHLALQLKAQGHPLSVVEFVAGSRVVGLDWETTIKRLETDGNANLAVTIESPSMSHRWVIESIKAAVESICTF